MRSEIIKRIDREIKSIWRNAIPFDYAEGWLHREDTLKNVLYFHLRTRLGQLFDKHNIRIYTEFSEAAFKGSGYRPDMVIAEVGKETEKDCLAVIEIKYKGGYTPSRNIIADYDKLHRYADDLKLNCKLYMATIWEYEDDPVTWERKNAAWAKGRLTELNASYKRGTADMHFYICEHK